MDSASTRSRKKVQNKATEPEPQAVPAPEAAVEIKKRKKKTVVAKEEEPPAIEVAEAAAPTETKKRKKKAAVAKSEDATLNEHQPSGEETAAPAIKKAKKVTIQEPESNQPAPAEQPPKKQRGRKKKVEKLDSSGTQQEVKDATPVKKKKTKAVAKKPSAEASLYYNSFNKSQTRISHSRSFHEAQNQHHPQDEEDEENVEPPQVEMQQIEPVHQREELLPEEAQLFQEEPRKERPKSVEPPTIIINPPAESPATVVVEEPKSIEQPPPKPKGARIVKPKEVVSVVKQIVVNNQVVAEQVEKKVVEIVQREAGPRIVKPIVVEVQTDSAAAAKRKSNEKKAFTKSKKLKEKVSPKLNETETIRVDSPKKDKAPDFKAIHEKEANKMESIDDFQKRLQQRHLKLTEKQSTPLRNLTAKSVNPKTSRTTPDQAVAKTGIEASNLGNLPRPNFGKAIDFGKIKKPTNQSTPNPDRPQPPTVLGTQNSNIPVFIHKPIKDAAKKTPKVMQREAESEANIENVEAKTPAQQQMKSRLKTLSTKTPTTLTKSNGKVKAGDTSMSRAVSTLARQQSENLPPQLATSSFIRRKSFDLNASLSRRLTYKPYVGKVKQMDFTSKPMPLVGVPVASTKSSGLNITQKINQ